MATIVTAFTAIAASIQGAIAAGGFLGALIKAGISIAINLGLSLLQQALNKRKVPGIKSSVTFGGDEPLTFIVGSWATPGHYEYVNSWGPSNNYLVQVYSLGDLPIDSLNERLWVNDEEVTLDLENPHATYGYPATGKYANYLWVKFYDGTQTTVDPYLSAKFGSDPDRPWESGMIGRGIPYAIVTSRLNRKLYTSVPKFKFEVEGVKLYDISKDTTAGGSGSHRWDTPSTWETTENPYVIAYNIFRGISYGGEWVYGGQTIDAARLPASAWIAAINEANADIDLSVGGTQEQFRVGMEISCAAEPLSVIEEFLVASQGRMSNTGGVYKPHCGAPGASVYSFTDDDIVITEGQSLDPFPSLDQTINALTATYPEPDEAWAKKEAPPLYDTDLEDEDVGRRLVNGITFECVRYHLQVQRLMQAMLLDARRFRTHTITLPPDAWLLEPGVDYISWTSTRNGYTAKQFLVTGIEGAPGFNQTVSLREVDPADYDWSTSDERDITPSVIGPFTPSPEDIVDWAVAGANLNGRPSIAVSYSGAQDDIFSVEVEVRKASDSSVIFSGTIPYSETGSLVTTILNGVFAPNTAYQARGRWVPLSDRDTNWSSWTNVTTPNLLIQIGDLDPGIQDLLDTTPPAVPTGLALSSVIGSDGRVTLTATWNANSETDLAGYDVEIKQGTGNYVGSGTSTNRYEWTVFPNTSYTVRVRARDTFGNASNFCTPVAHTSAADTTPPAAPTGVVATAGFKVIWLNWTPNTEYDLDYYEIFQANTATPAPTAGSTATYTLQGNNKPVDGLGDNVTRHFWVRAVDTSGNKSAWSTRVQATTAYIDTDGIIGPTPAVPAQPTLTSVTTLSNNGSSSAEITAVWTAAANAVAYEVGITPSGGNEAIFSSGGLRYVFPATVGLQYSVRIRSVNNMGIKSGWSTARTHTATGDSVAPAVPIGLAITAGFETLWLKWTANTEGDFSRYEIYESATTTAPTAGTAATFVTAATTLARTGLGVSAVTRHYWIRGVDTSGNKSAWSARVQGTTTEVDTTITTEKLIGLIDATSFAAGVAPVEIKSSLPTTGNYEGRQVTLTTDGKLYRYHSGAWTSAVPTTDLVGTISTSQIAAGAIDATKFASSISPIEIVSSLPTTGNYLGRQVFLTTDKKNYRYDGSAWTKAIQTVDLSGLITNSQIDTLASTKVTGQLSDSQLAAISAAKITGTIVAGQIASGAITTAKFASGITPVEIVSSLPTTGNFTGRQAFLTTDGKTYRYASGAWTSSVPSTDISGTIAAAQIAALEASKITGTLTSAQIASLDAAKLSGTIAEARLATLDASKLTGTIAEARLASIAASKVTGTLTSAQIASLDAAKLSGTIAEARLATLDAAKLTGTIAEARLASLAASKVTGTLSDSQLAAISAAKVTGQLTGSQLSSEAGSVSSGWITWDQAEMIGVTVPSGNTLTYDASDLRTGTHAARMASTNATGDLAGATTGISVELPYALVGALSGKRVRVAGWIKQPSSNAAVQCAVAYSTNQSGNSGWFYFTPTTSWQEVSFEYDVPASTSHDYVGFWGDTSGTGKETLFDNWRVEIVVDISDTVGVLTDAQIQDIAAAKITGEIIGTQITDGAISTAKLSAAAVTSAKIAAGTIVAANIASATITGTQIAASTIAAGNIAANAITATQLAANAVVAGKIASNAVTAATIAAGAVTAGKVAANAITATEIASGSITTAKIAAGAVTADEIATNAITAVKISAGAVTTAKIATGAVTANEIAANTITAAKIAANTITASQIAGATITATQMAANSITSTQLAANSVVAGKIATNAVTAGTIEAGAVTTAKIAAGAVTANEIAAATITAAKIATGTITATQIAGATITGSKIAAGTITGSNLVANTITATQIATGTITATQIAGATITGAKIAAGTIAASNIAANTITAGQIAANTITAAQIAANTITAGQIQAGAIGASEIAAGAITASKLLISNTTNLVPDPTMEDGASWGRDGNEYSVQTPGTPASWRSKLFYKFHPYYNTGNYGALTGAAFVVETGRRYRCSAQLNVTGGNGADVILRIAWYDSTGALISYNNWSTGARANAFYPDIPGSAVAPAGASLARVIAYCWRNTSTHTSDVYIGGLFVNLMQDGDLIVDGSVTADHIAANTITTGQIAAGGINADRIQSSTITTTQIAAGGVHANRIQANTITTSQIQAGGINGDRITANTLNADRIQANTITGGQIQAGAIGASEIAADSISAKHLVLADFSNIVTNDFTQGNLDGWTGAGENAYQYYAPDAAQPYGSYRVRTRSRDYIWDTYISCQAGDQFYVCAWVYNTHAGNAALLLETSTSEANVGYPNVSGSTTAKSTWTKLEGVYEIPAGVTRIRLLLHVERSNNDTADNAYWAKPIIRRAATSELIVDGAVTADKIAANTITAGQIQAGTITATEIAVGTITGDRLYANTITGAKIAAGAIGATQIDAGAIRAHHLLIANTINLVPDHSMEDDASWHYDANEYSLNTGNDPAAWSSRYVYKFTPFYNTSNYGNLYTDLFPVQPGREYYAAFQVYAYSGNGAKIIHRLIWYESDGTQISYNDLSTGDLADGTNTIRSGHAVAPSTASRAKLYIYCFRDTTNYTSSINIGSPTVYLKNDGDLIVDGAIQANHLTAGEVITGTAQIRDAIITNAKIANLDAAKITTGTLDAARIAANSIAASKINISGSTTLANWSKGGDATHIDGGQISTNTIRANSAVFGMRAISVEGIEFEHNKPGTNQVSWTAGRIGYVGDAGSPVSYAVNAGSATWTSGVLYLCFEQANNTLYTTTSLSNANADTRVVLATYEGGTNLNASYGRTIIDGSHIKTGTVTADRIVANAIGAGQLQTSNLITLTAQISDAIITSAKIVSLNANQIQAGTALAGSITVDGRALTEATDQVGQVQGLQSMTALAPRVCHFAGTLYYAHREPDTIITKNGEIVVDDSSYGNGTFTVAVGDVIETNRPVGLYCAGDSPASYVHAGNQFYDYWSRGDDYTLTVTALSDNAYVTVTAPGMTTGSFTVSAGQTVSQIIWATFPGVKEITIASTAAIVVSRNTVAGGGDRYQLVRPAREVVGRPNMSAIPNTGLETNYNNTSSGVGGGRFVRFPSTLGVLLIVGDSAGSDGEMGVAYDAMSKAYIVPHDVVDFALVAFEPGQIIIRQTNGSWYATLNIPAGTSKTNPYYYTEGDQSGAGSTVLISNGAIFTGNVPFYMRTNDPLTDREYVPEGWRDEFRQAFMQTGLSQASSIMRWSSDPAARVNNRSTQIDPGKILITGGTSLADWRKGGDLTKIDGGAISANTIDANKLTIGQRGIAIESLEFEHNKPSTNQLSWTAGTISYVGDAGTVVSYSVGAGSATWTSGTLYVTYAKAATVLSTTTSAATAHQSDRIILAVYKGGTDLVTDYGRTVIDGSHIKTGTITAGQIQAGEITADKLAVGNGGNYITNSDFRSGTTGWFISQQGATHSLTMRYDTYAPIGGAAQMFQSDGVSTNYADLRIYKTGTTTEATFPVVGGNRYQFSTYYLCHRSNGTMYIQWLDGSGNHISYSSLYMSGNQNSNPNFNLNGYAYVCLFASAPVNAAQAVLFIRKLGTASGSNSYMWVYRCMFSEANPNQSLATPWVEGGSTIIDGGNIVTSSLSAISANVGTVTAGKLQSADGKFKIDLDAGYIELTF